MSWADEYSISVPAFDVAQRTCFYPWCSLMALRRRSPDGLGGAIWPGFVDAMTAMLLVLTFVLSIFMITQYFLRETITGQENRIVEQEESLVQQQEALQQQEVVLQEQKEVLQEQEDVLEEKERTLDTLTSRLDSLSDLLSLERTEKENLTTEGTRLRASLASLTQEKEAADARVVSLQESLTASEERRANLDEALNAERLALEKQKAETGALQALTAGLEAEAKENITRLDDIERDLARATEALTEAESQKLLEQEAAKAMRARLETSEAAMTALELELDQRRADAEETLTLLAAANIAQEKLNADITERDDALTERQALLDVARSELATVEKASEKDQRQVALLNEQTRELRAQLRSLEDRLVTSEDARDTAESAAEERGEEIALLGTRLNAALAERNSALEANRALLEAQVDELEGFRSEFFGQIRKLLGGRDEIKIVGDRFVFQSEVLFEAASAELAEEGRVELGKFAGILNDIAGDIPDDLNWILRIDGHTDRRPIRNSTLYPDNWALSQARALSVAQYLIREHDVPPGRLAPTGFGEFQPIDDGDTPQAFARNRRIELKLTER